MGFLLQVVDIVPDGGDGLQLDALDVGGFLIAVGLGLLKVLLPRRRDARQPRLQRGQVAFHGLVHGGKDAVHIGSDLHEAGLVAPPVSGKRALLCHAVGGACVAPAQKIVVHGLPPVLRVVRTTLTAKDVFFPVCSHYTAAK